MSKASLPSSLLCFVPFQDEFYQQLQAIRQPWHIPSDTDSDILEPPEQDKSEWPSSLLSVYIFFHLTAFVYHLLIHVLHISASFPKPLT